MTAPTGRVRTGAEMLASAPDRVRGRRCGLVTNFTGVMPDLTRNVEALRDAGVDITALFGPEHGLRGSVQAGETEFDETDEESGLPLYDTYLKAGAELDDLLRQAPVDCLVFDMQDIGVRFYTYVWTMYDLMVAAANTGKPFVVLDRPNPLTGAVVDGPGVEPGFESFVGRVDVPMRHGLTAGELATLIAERFLPHRLELQVVRMAGFSRDQWFSDTGLPWVPPSPNMPTPDTALAFSGMGLFEGTNVSEGRGTTRPFETIGAPYVDGRLVRALRDAGLPGVAFREVWYVPTFHKYEGTTLRGVQLHITDRQSFQPVRTAVEAMSLLAELYPDDFDFLADDEGAAEARYAVDRLWGSASLRRTLTAGGDARGLLTTPSAPVDAYPSSVLLYGTDR